LVGGYLAANPQRKAKQAQQEIENKRNANQDAETAARDRDYHNEVTSQIAATTAQTKQKGDDAANTQLQNGAYTQASNLLASPPKDQDPQAWAQSVWRRATSPIASGGLGLTDPKLQGDLYAQVQDAVTKAVKAKADQFTGHEQALPTDPKARLSVLLKRLQVERGVPGVDTKVTQQMIADTQKQILDQENRLHQSVTDNFTQQRLNQGNQRISISLENAATRRAGGGNNSGLSDRANAIETSALAAPNQKAALRIVEQSGLNRRDRAAVRQDVLDQFKPDAVGHDTSGLSRGGLESYKHDHDAWALNALRDPDNAGPEPDPSDPKYQKMSDALRAPGGGGGGGAPATARTPTPAVPQKTQKWAKNPQTGQILYQYTDGHWGP
jgi:hypothetical protein